MVKVSVSIGEKEQKPVPYSGNQALISLWLYGKAAATQKAYADDIARFLVFAQHAPLDTITLRDLQEFADSLAEMKPASQARILSAVKSLLSFASKVMPDNFKVNAGAALRLPRWESRLAEQLLPEDTVQRMIWMEGDPRNHALLRLLYLSGIRRAELVSLKWRNLQERPELQTGQITVWGKGSKERTILLKSDLWRELQTLRCEEDASVFGICERQVYNIVRRAALRAGVKKPTGPHKLRHAHATISLTRGAPVNLVRQTLGHADLRMVTRYTDVLPDVSSGDYL